MDPIGLGQKKKKKKEEDIIREGSRDTIKCHNVFNNTVGFC